MNSLINRKTLLSVFFLICTDSSISRSRQDDECVANTINSTADFFNEKLNSFPDNLEYFPAHSTRSFNLDSFKYLLSMHKNATLKDKDKSSYINLEKIQGYWTFDKGILIDIHSNCAKKPHFKIQIEQSNEKNFLGRTDDYKIDLTLYSNKKVSCSESGKSSNLVFFTWNELGLITPSLSKDRKIESYYALIKNPVVPKKIAAIDDIEKYNSSCRNFKLSLNDDIDEYRN